MFFEKPSPGPVTFSRGEASSFGEIYDLGLESDRRVENLNARQRYVEEAYDQRIDAIKAATGIALENPERALMSRGGRWQEGQTPGPDRHDAFLERLRELSEQFPGAADVIRADRDPRTEAAEGAALAEGRDVDAMSRTPGYAKYGVRFAAGFRASLEDPFQVATLAVGPWRSVGVGAKAVAWSAIKQGAANAGVVATMQPAVQAWRREAGLDSGFSQAAANIAKGFMFGATVDAGGRAIARGLRRGRGAVPVLDARGGVTGWKKPEDALQGAVQNLPSGDLVKKAAEGDVDALRTLSAETGVDLDPAVRGALRALEIEGDLDGVPAHVDPSDADSRLLQALRAAEDPDEPAPGAAHLVPDQRTPNLADDQPVPAQRFSVEGKPVAIETIDPTKVTTDAATFQFKGGGDAVGANERLNGVQRWDPIAAGRAVVWERADGVRIVADGHQRAALAKRLADQKPQLQAFVFREADGWTARDVRALAAKKNLQEGSGSVIDAAKIIRERPDIIDKSVPLSSDAMRQARALARLSDEAFSDVVAGMAPPHYASMVADLVPDTGRHASVLREVMAADPRNVREARFMISDILQAETVHETQLTLLGAELITRSLLPERAKVLDGAVKILRDDQRIFRLLTREQQRIEAAGNRLSDANGERALEAASVQAAIEQLAATRGKVSDWLSDAARSTTAGVPQKMAAEAFARKVRDALERDGIKGLAAEPETLRAGGFDEPGGPDAQAQIDDLERALAPEIERALKPEKAAERQAVLFSLAPPDLQPNWNAGVVRGSGDEGANRGVREGQTGRADAALYKLSDYFANTGIDALAKRVEASSILKLRPWSKHPGRILAFHGTEASFDRFDLSKTADFGLHFGTSDQANKFAEGRAFRPKAAADGQMGRVFPVVLDLNSVVTLPDLGRWSPKAMVDELLKAGVRLPRALADDIRSRTANGADHTREWAYRELRAALTRQGIDGIRYLNTAEGGGLTWSYIVWEPGKVQSATTRDQLFALRSDPYVRTPAAERLRPEIQREILKTITMLPSDVKLRVTDRLAGVGGEAAAGMWDGFDRIVYVSLAAGDPVRTARHEVVHALKQSGLLSDQEFDTLYDFARRFGLREAYGIDKQYADVYRKAYGDRGKDYVESLLREETVANLFSDYSLNGRRFGDVAGGGVVDKIIDAIVEFMARVRNAVNGLGFRDVRDVFEAIETGAVARRAMRDVALPGSAASSVHGLHLFAITAYHGTPHTFEPEPGAPAGRFRLDKIGTGEGAQSYGYGLYFAENEGVAKSYRDNLSTPQQLLKNVYNEDGSVSVPGRVAGDLFANIAPDSIAKGLRIWKPDASGEQIATWMQEGKRIFDDASSKGRMYQVRINADPEDFLDWDKPLSQQSESVKSRLGIPAPDKIAEADRLAKEIDRMNRIIDGQGYGRDPHPDEAMRIKDDLVRKYLEIDPSESAWWKFDAKDAAARPEAAAKMREAGIPGVKYLDRTSRAAGEGSRNYVVFDPSIVEITHVDGRPVAAFGAEIADAERMGHLQNMAEACRL